MVSGAGMVVIGAGGYGSSATLEAARPVRRTGAAVRPEDHARRASDAIMMLGPYGRTGFSGGPYYLMRALQREAAGSRSVSSLDLKVSKIAAAAWALRFRSSRRFYTLSQAFMDRQVRGMSDLARHKWLVCFQVAPDELINSGADYYIYIDMTLNYYMSNYGLRISPTAARALRRSERRSYQSAKAIFCYEEGAKRELIEDFDLCPSKIHVVGRGVNIDERDAPFTIGFHGRDAQRKGLYKLVAAIDEFDEAERASLRVLVIGPKSHQVPRRPYLDYRGRFGDRDRRSLVDTLKAVDVGFLASSGDTMPGGVFELLSLGKPVITTELPGLFAGQSRSILFIDPAVTSADLRRAIAESKTLAPRIPPSLTDVSWPSVARRMLQVIA